MKPDGYKAMNKEILEILDCPDCKGDLRIESDEEGAAEIVNGRLICDTCGLFFPVKDGIPNFLSPDSGGA